MNRYATASTSPFHAGEQTLQTRAGKRNTMEHFGRRVIRPYMPEQHRAFYAQLPFLVLGAVDDDGSPWATLLCGEPGFVNSPDETTLEIDALPSPGDPAIAAAGRGKAVGILGIELATRRRNRMNGRVVAGGANRLAVRVDQAFGNCPQYIQSRAVSLREVPTAARRVESFVGLPDTAAEAVREADTFFVSSYVPARDNPLIEGVDVSHRGGQAGFVKVEGNTLTVPDFPGNNHFNTLGNFYLNPRAGLVFPDFERGDLLQLTGSVELLDDQHPEVASFRGAERAWRVHVTHGRLLRGALPLHFGDAEPSPNNALTDNWPAAVARSEAEIRRDAWQAQRVMKISEESASIRSIYLAPVDGSATPAYQAGQHLPVRVTPEPGQKPLMRTYTLSSVPTDAYYRISVKREAHGAVSRYLHDTLRVGDVIEARGPRGAFHIGADASRPVLLLGGGVGVTPMVAMARHLADEALRTRQRRAVTIFHAAHSVTERGFADFFRALEQRSNSAIRYYSVVSDIDPAEAAMAGVDFVGRLGVDVLRATVPLDDYDCYLCGPPGFMQAQYDALRELGVADERIYAESFGPSSLRRDLPEPAQPLAADEADHAIVAFTRSGFEQAWQYGDGTLLEVAEAHGLSPPFSCRSGTCGSCATRMHTGSVVNRNPVGVDRDADHVLLCSAVPAKGCQRVEIDL